MFTLFTVCTCTLYARFYIEMGRLRTKLGHIWDDRGIIVILLF